MQETELKEPIILDTDYTGLPEGVPINPAQELVVPYIDDPDVNILCAWPTGSGKSTAITMVGAQHLFERERVAYIGIMKALAQEKADDWKDKKHPWSVLNRAVISGDYRMDKDKEKEINRADLISITPESLASRLRHPDSERNRWLSEVGLLAIDEIHLLTAPDRGTHMEAGLMEFTAEFPKCQLLGLSGTVPNVEDIAKWMTKLNGKQTVILKSDYRPVPIEWHWVEYDPGYSRDESEDNRIDIIIDLIRSKPKEQFMVAVWQKVFGNKIKDALRKAGIKAEFHSANSDKAERSRIEQGFRNGIVPVVISTSTLFTGVNLPSPNMIITATESNRKPIPAYEILQAAGRAGRVKFNKEGHVYVLLTARSADMHKARILRGEPVESHMAEVPILATHFLGACYLGRITSAATFHTWFSRTLAYDQLHFTEVETTTLLNSVMNDMESRRMVKLEQHTGEIKLTYRGQIAAQMYMDPYHFFDVIMNLHKYAGLENPSDLDLGIALGRLSGFRQPGPSKLERQACQDEVLNTVPEEYAKSVACVLYRVRGENVPPPLSNTNFMVYEDMSRMHSACLRAHDECEHFAMTNERINGVFIRVIRRCSEQDAELQLKSFSPSERKKLFSIGLYSLRDVQDNIEMASTLIPRERLMALGALSKSGGTIKRAFGGRGSKQGTRA